MIFLQRYIEAKISSPRMFAILTLLIAGLSTGVGSANACGGAGKAAASPSMPWMQQQDETNWQSTIVGLWHVVYTESDGTLFAQTFKMWHSDGIEFENALLPPSGGICYGVWKQTGGRSVKLHHIGIIWGSDGKIAATFTVDEENTVSEDGKSYSGTFEFNQFDPSGNPAGSFKGTTAAKRVTFKTPSTEVD